MIKAAKDEPCWQHFGPLPRAARMLPSRDSRVAVCLRSGGRGWGWTRGQHVHRLSNVNGNSYFAFDGSPESAMSIHTGHSMPPHPLSSRRS
jgi:hypothetical protein